jgi:copper resistance protein C
MRKELIFGMAVALFSAGPVFGHAKLLSTLPAAESQLARAPASLTLTFNETVRLATLKLTADGRDIPLTFDRNAAASSTIIVPVPSLGAGTYRVQWSALTASDGHAVKGSYSFAIR